MFDWLMIFSLGVESDGDRFWQSYEVLLKVKIILDEWEKSKLLMSFFIIVFNVKLHSFLKVQTLEFVKLLNKVIKLRILQKIDEQNVLIKILLRHLAKLMVKVFKHKKDFNLNNEKLLRVFVIRVLTKEIIKVVRNVNLKLKENKKKSLISNKSNQFEDEMQPIWTRGRL